MPPTVTHDPLLQGMYHAASLEAKRYRESFKSLLVEYGALSRRLDQETDVLREANLRLEKHIQDQRDVIFHFAGS